jgi:hypothetical protein
MYTSLIAGLPYIGVSATNTCSKQLTLSKKNKGARQEEDIDNELPVHQTQ